MRTKIMQIKQGSAEWHQQRANKVTGSRFPKAVREDAWTKGDEWEALGRDLYREANGLKQDPFDERAQQAITYGKEHEPIAINHLKSLGYQIKEASFVQHPDHDWLGMSPDGIIKKGRKGKVSAVEVKCPVTKLVTNVKEQKRNYWHQMQLGMEVMDIEEMLFFQWSQTGDHVQEWVERDPQWAKIYLPKAKEFIDWYKEKSKDPEYIARWAQDKEAPGINYKSVEEDNKTLELAEILKELKEIDERKKTLEPRKKELSTELIKQHRGAFSTPRVKCHMTQAKGRVNYTRLVKEEGIEFDIVERYRVEGDARIYTKLLEEE